MKKNILMLAILFVISSEFNYSPKQQKIKSINNASKAIVHLNRNQINSNLSSGANQINSFLGNSFDSINLYNSRINEQTLFNYIKSYMNRIPASTLNSISSKRYYIKEIDGLIGLINANYQYSSNNYQYSSYYDPFFQNYQSIGYEDLGFTAPIDTRTSNFDSYQYLLSLGASPKIAALFSGTYMLLIGTASGIIISYDSLVLCVCIIVLTLCLISLINVINSNYSDFINFIQNLYYNISDGLNIIVQKISELLNRTTGVITVNIANKDYEAVPYSLVDVAAYLSTKSYDEYYIIPTQIHSNLDYWYIIPQKFSYDFIVRNRIYDLGFNTYTRDGGDADSAIFYGSSNCINTIHHSYTSNSTIKLSANHYHAVVGPQVKAPHSFYGIFYGTALSQQPVC